MILNCRRRTAERMLVTALNRARFLHAAAVEGLYWPEGGFGALLEGKSFGSTIFSSIDDYDVWVALKRWSEHADPILSELALGLVRRRLWKSVSLDLDAEETVEARVSRAKVIAKRRGFSPEHHVLVDESSDSPYRPFIESRDLTKSIKMVSRSGNVATIEERSEVVRMLGQVQHRQCLLIAPAALMAELRVALDD